MLSAGSVIDGGGREGCSTITLQERRGVGSYVGKVGVMDGDEGEEEEEGQMDFGEV
jgi:hypothetical protein